MREKPVYILKRPVAMQVDESVWYEGYVYDNPNFEDGTYIHTSRVVAVRKDRIVTLNSQYMLLEED